MKDFVVSVKKLTDADLMREACQMTFIGKSHQSLLSIYKTEHSPVRSQLFWVKFEGIPLYISTHLLRHHVGSVPFQFCVSFLRVFKASNGPFLFVSVLGSAAKDSAAHGEC